MFRLKDEKVNQFANWQITTYEDCSNNIKYY